MKIMFIDFEASSLAPDSWPIEIGAAWISDLEIKARASLIRPRPEWPETAWDARSAAIHGIPRAALGAAPDADALAEDFAALLRGALILSDAPEFDQRWADRLFDGRTPTVRLADFHALAAERFGASANALDWLYETLARTPAPHRAGADARRLAKAWLEASRRVRR